MLDFLVCSRNLYVKPLESFQTIISPSNFHVTLAFSWKGFLIVSKIFKRGRAVGDHNNNVPKL